MADKFITRNDLPDMADRMRRGLKRATTSMAAEVQGNIQDNAPVDKGRLQGSWMITRNGDFEATVSSNVKYALVQNEGSDPYEIYPRKGSALKFEIGGQTIFAKSVSHPGIAGTNYIDAAISTAEGRRNEFIESALQEVDLI